MGFMHITNACMHALHKHEISCITITCTLLLRSFVAHLTACGGGGTVQRVMVVAFHVYMTVGHIRRTDETLVDTMPKKRSKNKTKKKPHHSIDVIGMTEPR